MLYFYYKRMSAEYAEENQVIYGIISAYKLSVSRYGYDGIVMNVWL